MELATQIILGIIGSAALSAPLALWLNSVLTKDRYKAETAKLVAEAKKADAEANTVKVENMGRAYDVLLHVTDTLRLHNRQLQQENERYRTAIAQLTRCPAGDRCPVDLQLQQHTPPEHAESRTADSEL